MMNKDIFVKLLQERRYKSVKDVLDVMNAVDIASLLGEFDDKELALAFRLIPKEKAADVFANMESSLQSVLVEALSEKELKEILNDLYMDDTVDLFEELPANLVTRILDASGPKERETINKLLKLSGRQRRKYHDNRIRRSETVSDSRTGTRTYQENRYSQRNHLYLLCDPAAETARYRVSKRSDDNR